MEFEVKFSQGEGGEEYPAGPAVMDSGVSMVHIAIGPEHMKRISQLKPGAKVRIVLRGSVQSFEQKAQEGYGAPVGELCIMAQELSASRGSEYDELLEED